MPEMKFTDFIQKHGKTSFAINSTPHGGPSGSRDMNEREFPIPYQLLREWCGAYLKNDWAITQRSIDLLLVVESAEEESQIREMLKVSGNAKITEAGESTYSTTYGQAEYRGLAGDLGYVF